MINEIKKLAVDEEIIWSKHVLIRMKQRNISIADIVNVLINGEIIEEYMDDYPYPSYLILGVTKNNKCCHVVCAIGEGKLWIITTYIPDCEEWESDMKSRRLRNEL